MAKRKKYRVELWSLSFSAAHNAKLKKDRQYAKREGMINTDDLEEAKRYYESWITGSEQKIKDEEADFIDRMNRMPPPVIYNTQDAYSVGSPKLLLALNDPTQFLRTMLDVSSVQYHHDVPGAKELAEIKALVLAGKAADIVNLTGRKPSEKLDHGERTLIRSFLSYYEVRLTVTQ